MLISTIIAIFRIPRETRSGFSTRSITWNRVPYVSWEHIHKWNSFQFVSDRLFFFCLGLAEGFLPFQG